MREPMLKGAHFADELASVHGAKDNGGGVALAHDLDAAVQDLQHTVDRIAFAKEKIARVEGLSGHREASSSESYLSHQPPGALT
jgi:hypothetical protein